jgi:hypothetical protein
MRKVLLTVVSAALMGASTLSGAVVPNAFAQTQAGGTLADATALEGQVVAACAVSDAEFRSVLGSYSALMAQLVASGAISSDEAAARSRLFVMLPVQPIAVQPLTKPSRNCSPTRLPLALPLLRLLQAVHPLEALTATAMARLARIRLAHRNKSVASIEHRLACFLVSVPAFL